MVTNRSSSASKLRIRRAQPLRLFEQAVEQIKSLIVEGHLKPGDKLPSENKLSEMLVVSRASVREALRSLESKGIIEVKSGSGTYISENALALSSMHDAMLRLFQRRDQVLPLLQVRQAMERLTVTLAASKITLAQIDKLDAIIQRQEMLLSNDGTSEHLEDLAHLDSEFHTEISAISGNSLADEILNALIPAFLEDNKAIFFVEKGLRLVDEHRAIVNAMREHDIVLADASMHRHIGRVIEEVETFQSSIEESIGNDSGEQEV